MNEVYTDLERQPQSAIDALKPAQEDFNKQMAENPYERSARLNREQIEKEDPNYFGVCPEDIRIGYECEQRIWYLDIPPVWKKTTLKSTIVKIDDIRVPYLTKEQIEAEGWRKSTTSDVYFRKEVNGQVYLLLSESTKIIIRKGSWFPEETIYNGECKDINTFRYISKLLNI